MSTTVAGTQTGSSPVPAPLTTGRTLPIAAGPVLLMLDTAALLLLWPATVLVMYPAMAGAALAATLLVYPAVALFGLYATGLYRREAVVAPRRAMGRVPAAAALAALGGALVLLPFLPDASRAALPAGVAALVSATSARLVFEGLRRRGLFSRTLLVLGAGKRAWDLVFVLRKEGRTLGYKVYYLHDPKLGARDERLLDPAMGVVHEAGPGGILSSALRLKPDEIVVAPDERRGMDLQGLLDCKIAGFPVSEYLAFLEREVQRVDVKRIEMGWLLYSDGFAMGPLERALKRLVDVSVSLAVLTVMSPFLAAAAIGVRMQDGGPALYRQTRVTQGGKRFEILKLRTMTVNAEKGGAAWAAAGDSRITRLGMFLRRTRLDELPQLINVLRGEMSFVGPRPERPEFVEMLAQEIPLYRERHAMKAGLTGWAQVNYPYGASIDDARSKLSYDLYYVKNYSPMLDVRIIIQTLRVVLWPSGVR
jgi:sugar transferase (PEP-CTERM system associated)